MSFEVQSHFLTLAQGHLHMKIKTLFSQKPLGGFELNFVYKEIKICWHNAWPPMYGKNRSKIFFSGTGRPISKKIGM